MASMCSMDAVPTEKVGATWRKRRGAHRNRWLGGEREEEDNRRVQFRREPSELSGAARSQIDLLCVCEFGGELTSARAVDEVWAGATEVGDRTEGRRYISAKCQKTAFKKLISGNKPTTKCRIKEFLFQRKICVICLLFVNKSGFFCFHQSD